MSTGLQLSDEHFDALREMGNIGSGHAATALSTLLQEPVRVSVTAAALCGFDDIIAIVGGPETFVTGVFVRMHGDVSGNMLLLLSTESSRQLVHKLLKMGKEEVMFDELAVSVLAEVGNILAGSYTTAIATLSGLLLQQSVPGVAIDMAGAILDASIAAVGTTSDAAVLIDTDLYQGDERIRAHFFVLPDLESTPRLLRAFGFFSS